MFWKRKKDGHLWNIFHVHVSKSIDSFLYKTNSSLKCIVTGSTVLKRNSFEAAFTPTCNLNVPHSVSQSVCVEAS